MEMIWPTGGRLFSFFQILIKARDIKGKMRCFAVHKYLSTRRFIV